MAIIIYSFYFDFVVIYRLLTLVRTCVCNECWLRSSSVICVWLSSLLVRCFRVRATSIDASDRHVSPCHVPPFVPRARNKNDPLTTAIKRLAKKARSHFSSLSFPPHLSNCCRCWCLFQIQKHQTYCLIIVISQWSSLRWLFQSFVPLPPSIFLVNNDSAILFKNALLSQSAVSCHVLSLRSIPINNSMGLVFRQSMNLVFSTGRLPFRNLDGRYRIRFRVGSSPSPRRSGYWCIPAIGTSRGTCLEGRQC